MEMEAWESIPENLKRLDRCLFREPACSNTWYFIKAVESDISQLVFITGKGTCLDKSLDRTYELQVYEVSPVAGQPGYFDLIGLSGQFNNPEELANYYGVTVDEIMAEKLSPSHLYIYRG